MKVKSVAEKTVNRRKFIKTSCKKSLGALLGLSTLAGSKCKSGSLRMPKRILGRTGLEVSLLGFGCTQVKDQAAFRRAIELGVNYFHMGDRDPSCNRAACEVLVPFRKDIYITYMSFPKNSSEEFLKDLENFLQQSGF
ncbi:hypothetical protein JW935_19625, partial [candidate division KSB1 bacterium]|nr:hypothetical protein [candidate division KSB1 bacterium]